MLHSAALEDNVELVESLAIRFGADYIDGKNRLPFEVAGIPSRIILQRLQLYLERYDIDSYNVRLNQNQPCQEAFATEPNCNLLSTGLEGWSRP